MEPFDAKKDTELNDSIHESEEHTVMQVSQSCQKSAALNLRPNMNEDEDDIMFITGSF